MNSEQIIKEIFYGKTLEDINYIIGHNWTMGHVFTTEIFTFGNHKAADLIDMTAGVRYALFFDGWGTDHFDRLLTNHDKIFPTN